MAQRWLHCIDQDGLHVFASQRGTLRPARVFAASDAGAEAFARWLQHERVGGIHTLLVDLPDEGFQAEAVPHVIGADRKAMLQRRMTQHFFGTPYVTALSLGRENNGRRDERILYAALTRPAVIEPWLNVMRQHPLAISALYTPALLLRSLLDGIRPHAPRGLIVALSHTGIRQIYFEDGRLRFARLSPAPEGGFARWAPDCLRETQKTYQYLNTQRLLPRGSRLPVWLLLHDEDIRPVMSELADGDSLQFHAVDIAGLANRLALRIHMQTSDARPLFMQLASREPRVAQLAPEADRRFFKLWRTRTALLAAGVVCLAAGLLLALKFQVDAFNLRQDTTQAQADERFQRTQYDRLLRTLPNMPTDLDQLNSVIARYDAMQASDLSPRPALVTLSHALDDYPDVDVKRIEWRAEPAEGNTAKPGDTHHVLTVRAQLSRASGADARATIARIHAFTNALQTLSGGKVVLTHLPYDIESDKTLRSDAEVRARDPEFEFRLTAPGSLR